MEKEVSVASSVGVLLGEDCAEEVLNEWGQSVLGCVGSVGSQDCFRGAWRRKRDGDGGVVGVCSWSDVLP